MGKKDRIYKIDSQSTSYRKRPTNAHTSRKATTIDHNVFFFFVSIFENKRDC